MTSLRRSFRRLLAVLRFAHAEDDLSREIAAHLQLIEDDLVARGMTREAARLAARRTFGGVEQAKEHQRDARAFRWLDDSRIDCKLGARMLVKYPGLSLIGGAGLAVAMAIGASFFALLYSVAYSTLPLDDGDRIVALENWDVDRNNEERRAMHDLIAWRSDMKSVEQISAFRTIGRNLIVPGGSSEPVRVAQMTASGFQLARVSPILGRPIVAADELRGALPALVIGHDVWQSRFGGDTAVIGREVRLGTVAHTIVGVMPAGFGFPVSHGYWTALSVDAAGFGRLDGPAIFIFGRLRDGVTMAQAQAELSTLGARAAAAFPATHAKLQPRVMPYAHPILDIQGMTAWQFSAMQSTVTMLLLIVAVNVAILIYARTAARQGEIAVRTALGASRRRIVAQLFIEALVLSCVSAAAGVLLARFGMSQGFAILAEEGGGLPYWIDASIPAATIIYAGTVALLVAVIAGVVPALYATGRHVQSRLKPTGSSDGLRLGRTWTALIVGQVALAVAGLPATVALGWNESRGALTLPAFDEEPFLTATISPDPESSADAGIDQPGDRSLAQQRFTKLETDLVASLEAESAVADVTVAEQIPGDEGRAQIIVDDEAPPRSGAPLARVNRVAGDFFDALDARVLAGRGLAATDAAGAPVVVVNRAFVHRILGDGNAIGRRVRYLGVPQYDAARIDTAPTYEIVGVVTDLMTNRADPDLIEPAIFHPRQPAMSATMLIRIRGANPGQFGPRLRTLVASFDPSARVAIRAFTELKRQQVLAFRLVVIAMTLIVISVLMLSAAGIYAMMSFIVSQRRKEIGIRAAMGADARRLLFAIFSTAAKQLGTGVIAGAVLAAGLDAASGGELLGSIGRSLLPVMAVVMIAVGLIAAIGPARRGLKVQPTDALRAE